MLGSWSTEYVPGSIAVAGGIVAWTVAPASMSTTGGGFYTATENSANSAAGPVATDSNIYWGYGTGGIGLRSNGGTGYTLIEGGTSSVTSCALAGIGGSCSAISAYTGGEAIDDLVLSGSTLYWTDFASQTVSSMSTAGGSATTIASGEAGPVLVTVDSVNVYWANLSGASNSYNIDKNTQSNPVPTASSNVLPFTAGSMTSLATDGTYVYFSGALGSTKVGYVSVAGAQTGTTLYPLPSGGSGAATVIYVNHFVYWADEDENTIRGIAAPLPPP
jgi:hypothetical protein